MYFFVFFVLIQKVCIFCIIGLIQNEDAVFVLRTTDNSKFFCIICILCISCTFLYFFVIFSCIIGTCRKTVGPGRDWGVLHLNICLGAGQMLRWMLWGVFWEHDTDIYGPFWSHIGTILGSFLDHFMWYVCYCLKESL